MRVGIHLPQYGRVAGRDAIVASAERAETLGFADIWVSDHIVHPAAQTYPSPHLFDPFVTLTWAAASTNTIGLGTSVIVVPQYHPLWLANTTSSIDALSGGRLTLGVGVGWSEAEFDALGQDFHTRGKRTDEILDILRLCWTTDPASYQGEFYRFTDIRVLPKPAHPIPIWVGGAGNAARQRARGYGSGYQLIGLKPDTIRPAIEELRADHPDPESFTISLRTGWDPQGMPATEIADECAAFEAAGVQHVVAAPWRTELADWLRSMELLADIVGLAP